LRFGEPDDRAADEGAVTPNADWWDRAKLPPRPQAIEIRNSGRSQHRFSYASTGQIQVITTSRVAFKVLATDAVEIIEGVRTS
jgi:hypothetical protein